MGGTRHTRGGGIAMLLRTISSAAIAIAALSASLAVAPGADARASNISAPHTIGAQSAAFAAAPIGRCYWQLDDDTGKGAVSQNFEAVYDDFDSRGADDFFLQSACTVRRIDVIGEYVNGSGPADSANVTFYRNFSGAPGGVISNQDGLQFLEDGHGGFRISLLTGVGLAPGRYFVSVQMNLDYNDGGEWLWHTNRFKHGYLAYWRNKGDGFGTRCVQYTRMTDCLGRSYRDFSFALLGN